MNVKKKIFWRWAASGGISAAILALAAAGGSAPANAANSESSGAPAVSGVNKGGPELWAENCARCHNYRSPTSYSNAQWEVVLQHMRVRANLTAEEYTKILDFLKSVKK